MLIKGMGMLERDGDGLECWNGMTTTNLGAYNDHLWAKTTLKLDYPVKRLIANL